VYYVLPKLIDQIGPSFGVTEVVSDAISDLVGQRNGIRYMANELGPSLDRW
jgi:hypothetical protein